MGRPKGSKNKKEETPDVVVPVEAVEAVKVVEPVKMEAPARLVGHPIAEVKTAYEARPDMGGIRPPAKSEQPCDNCKHVKGMHYGPTEAPEITWCNVAACKCQAFS